MQKYITIENAFINNLNIPYLQLPLNRFVVITGASGSGKTSLIRDVLVQQSQVLNNLDNVSSLYNIFGNYDYLKVKGLTPIKYLGQKFVTSRKRLNLAQFIGIETQINLLFSNFGNFANSDSVSQSFNINDIGKIILESPKLTEELSAKRGEKYRYIVTTPLHINFFPELIALDLVLQQQSIQEYNKQVINAIFTQFPIPPDLVIVNKKYLYDTQDLRFDYEEIKEPITCLDRIVIAINKDHILDAKFSQKIAQAITEEEEHFQKLFLQHAGLKTSFAKVHLETTNILKSTTKENKYTDAVRQELRKLYPPTLGIYSPFTQTVKDYPLLAVAKNNNSNTFFNINEPNAFSTFGKNRCKVCNGSGLDNEVTKIKELDEVCSSCHGIGLANYIVEAQFEGKRYIDLYNLSIEKLHDFFNQSLAKCKIATQEEIQNTSLQKSLSPKAFKAALLNDIVMRLENVIAMNLTYLSLVRKVHTLSGGEIQPIQLSKVLSNETSGVTYILDEPSIGLHPINNQRLIDKLKELVNRGNSVIVVEHDRDFISQSDYVLILQAGNISFAGTPEQLRTTDLPLAKYLNFHTPISQTISTINNNHYAQELEKMKSLTTQESLSNILINTDYSGLEDLSIQNIKNIAKKEKSTLAQFLSPRFRNTDKLYPRKIVYQGVNVGYFDNVDISFKYGAINVISGVSGSGKSIFANRILFAATKAFLRLNKSDLTATGKLKSAFVNEFHVKGIKGVNSRLTNLDEQIDTVIYTNQTPENREATILDYIGLNEPIALLFEETSKRRSKAKYIQQKDFILSNREKKNKCPECHGKRTVKFIIDNKTTENVTCFECKGTGFAPYVLSEYLSYDKNSNIRLNISDFYNISIDNAYNFFLKYHKAFPSSTVKTIITRLAHLKRFRLGHLILGRSIQEISGGETQRLYLIKEIMLSNTKKRQALIVVDEPTTGLHFNDVQSLLDFFVELKNLGHTIIIIEHNIDFIYNADYYLEFGPGANEKGGQVVFAGSITQALSLVDDKHKNNKTSNNITQLMEDLYNYDNELQAYLNKL